MASIQTEAENSVNTFIKEQAKLPGKCSVKLAQFDNYYEVVQKLRSAKKFPKFELAPRGATALYDAICTTVDDLGAELAKLPEEKRPGKVLVVIVTDGFENASQTFDQQAVKDRIEHQKEVYGWDFVFLAANQDAVTTGAAFGINRGSTMTFDANPVGVHNTTNALNTYTSSLRSGEAASFTEKDREEALKKN